jgi:hypothetical protein
VRFIAQNPAIAMESVPVATLERLKRASHRGKWAAA